MSSTPSVVAPSCVAPSGVAPSGVASSVVADSFPIEDACSDDDSSIDEPFEKAFIEVMLHISKRQCPTCELRYLADNEMHEKCGEGSKFASENGKVFCEFPDKVMIEARQRFCEKMHQSSSKSCSNCATMLRIYTRCHDEAQL